jgi:hypothetical protein
MGRVAILVPDGVGVRNYLYSNVVKGRGSDFVIIHSFSDSAIELIKKESGIVFTERIPFYTEGLLERFYREVIHRSRLIWNSKQVKNPTILFNYNPNKKKLKSKLFYFLVELCSKFIRKYEHILYLESKYRIALKRNPSYKVYRDTLQKLNINVLLCTHQRALVAPILYLIADDLNVKTLAVIYSWDNIPKGRLALRADEYLVWSSYMKRELIEFYPEIKDRQIVVTGSPQFEFALNEDNIIDKELFFRTHGLDLNKKIICFSANDLYSPNEVSYLEDLINDLHCHNAFEKYQLLFRLNPADLSGRFNNLLENNREFIRNVTPLWKITSANDWLSTIPTKEDQKLLVSTCFYSDVAINLGSTMVFDFAIFNKPCLYIKYNQDNLHFDVNTIYQFQHFRSMPTKNSVGWINSKIDFFNTIEEVLNSSKVDARNWFDIIVENLDNASHNIQTLLNK